jgi:predicted secreted hydrolase
MNEPRARPLVTACALAVLLAVTGLAVDDSSRGRRPARPVQATIGVTEALGGGDTSGFARALAPRPLVFPLDHGPHPEFRTEWWYYTGNVRAEDGRHLGFQLTFFRHGLAADSPARASRWATHQVYLAHFAVTDTRAGRFHAFARTSRGALGLAGAESLRFGVWLDGWRAEAASDGGLPMRLVAAERGIGIDLSLDSVKPVVLQGHRGLSQKGPEPGNASYYYSLTRMPARGVVRLGGARLAVEGLAWMDHEWSTSALGAELGGWDWFAVQLEDGRELMLYRLRRRDGTADPHSAGTLIDANGGTRTLGRDDVRVETLATWQSPESGVRYPARWRLTVPGDGLALEVLPMLAAQELMVGPRYWEGAVGVRGTDRGRPVGGHGYAELVGYGEASGR